MSDSTLHSASLIARPPDRRGTVDSISKHGFHQIAYVEWGDPTASRLAVCVHGLTRQGRDFDPLASALADRGWRVICPDLVGRGRSGWLRDPQEYALPQYAMDMTVLISRAGIQKVDWIGTSLGGLIGVVMAGQEHSPVQTLVVNDIGPLVPWQALMRIGNDIRSAPTSFRSYESAVAYYRRVLAPFGNLTHAEWDHLVRHGVGRGPDGGGERYMIPALPPFSAPFSSTI